MSNVIDALIAELDQILTQIREVQAGDIILSEDHNNVKKALDKIREIIEYLKGLGGAPTEEKPASGLDPIGTMVYLANNVDSEFEWLLYDVYNIDLGAW